MRTVLRSPDNPVLSAIVSLQYLESRETYGAVTSLRFGMFAMFGCSIGVIRRSGMRAARDNSKPGIRCRDG